MAKSNAERQRECRARRNADPQRREKYLRKERERWKRDTEAGKKKSINDLSKRAQRRKRKEWRKAKERQKRKSIGCRPPFPGTMRIHQVITLARGEITSRDVSCMRSTYGKLECECWNTKHFSFVRKVPATVSQMHKQINWDDPEVIGEWCALTYDQALYPGIILATDETDVQVKCMRHARITKNRFFWPLQEDILWYPFDDVLELIPPPQPVIHVTCKFRKRSGTDRLMDEEP